MSYVDDAKLWALRALLSASLMGGVANAGAADESLPADAPRKIQSDSGLVLQIGGTSDPKVTCRYEKKLGSKMKTKVCRSTEPDTASQRQMEEWQRKAFSMQKNQ